MMPGHGSEHLYPVMRRAIALFVGNPVAAKPTLIFVVVSGLVGATDGERELYPEAALDHISIEVPYLGAAPEEVEAGVVIRIEEGIEGIEEVRAVAAEGMASMTVELETGADPQRVVDEVENNVSAITTLPVESERPIVRRMTARDHVTDIAVSGPVDAFALKLLAPNRYGKSSRRMATLGSGDLQASSRTYVSPTGA